jgi:glycosyltransferase involved in cell wall biosynthesis
MKRKLYYITRSFAPFQKGGGPLMRKSAVSSLKALGWDVVVVMPNYHDSALRVDDKIIQIPFFHIQKLASLLEKIGIFEDYLDIWVNKAYQYLRSSIKQDDILFATSGGDLATIKLASLLQKEIGCRFVINFRDPIVYTLVNGLKVDKKPHVSREKAEQKYISNADLIITSSNSFKEALSKKYPLLKEKIVNNYFGYIEAVTLMKKRKSDKLRIAYSGSMRSVQKPELLYEAFKKLGKENDIELYFIGDASGYAPVKNLQGVKLIPFMEHETFLTFMQEHIDVGFVSLASDYLGVCVPSKIYEYINLSLPILGALPHGDGMDIINNLGYGKAVYFSDVTALSNALESFLDPQFLATTQKRIEQERDKWCMDERIKEVDMLLRRLA